MDHFLEEWKPIVGYEGFYEISNTGSIKRVNAYHPSRVGVLLKPVISNQYLGVSLSKRNVVTNKSIHLLVLEHFVGPKPEGSQGNHIDGVKTNNRVDNLEWVSPAENIRHAMNIDLRRSHSSAKFNWKMRQLGVTETTFAIGFALAAILCGVDLSQLPRD